MRITKAKLIKGAHLEVSYEDGTAIVNKSYGLTEAPPKLVKSFQRLNSHLCDLTEQFDPMGVADYDNIAARGYSIKGEGEKEGVTITGVRTLATGRSITLNTPFIGMDIAESDYPGCKALVSCLDKCREEIMSFMENNKGPEEIQGKLDLKTIILSPEKTAQQLTEDALNGAEVDVTDLYPGMPGYVKMTRNNPLASEMQKDMREIADEIQFGMDEEMPITIEMQQMVQADNAKKNAKKKK